MADSNVREYENELVDIQNKMLFDGNEWVENHLWVGPLPKALAKEKRRTGISASRGVLL